MVVVACFLIQAHVTPSPVVTNARSLHDMVPHSCLIQIAIDNLTNTVLTNVFLSLSATNLFLQYCDIVIICLTQTFQVNNKCMLCLCY